MKNLIVSDVKRAKHIIIDVFRAKCDNSVIEITDEIHQRFINVFGFEFEDEDLFYTAMDRYKELSECYTVLAFNLELYHQGKTRKEWFWNICESFASLKRGDL